MNQRRFAPSWAAALLLAGCTTTNPAARPEIERRTAFRVWYTGPELKAELEHRWATRHPGDEWVVLDLAVAGGPSGVTPISRENIVLLTPTGLRLPLLDQATFRRIESEVVMALKSYDSWQPFSQRFDARMRPCRDWFFSTRGAFNHRETIYPSAAVYCHGPLVFRVPGGAQPGQWTLLIQTEEGTARIPFGIDEQ